jgi:hypothetical protein
MAEFGTEIPTNEVSDIDAISEQRLATGGGGNPATDDVVPEAVVSAPMGLIVQRRDPSGRFQASSAGAGEGVRVVCLAIFKTLRAICLFR